MPLVPPSTQFSCRLILPVYTVMKSYVPLGGRRNRQTQRPAEFPPTYEEALESPPYEEPPLVSFTEMLFSV
jgi:hypothetical protein